MTWRLLFLALFAALPAVAAHAQGAAQPAIILAQADVNASDFLADRRQPPSLSNDELKMRLANGRRLLQSTSISASDRLLVEAAVKSATMEMDRRATASKPAGATDENDAATQPGQQPDKDRSKSAAKKKGTLSLDELLADDRTPDELGKKELRDRIRSARALIKGGSLAKPDRRKVQALYRAARQEMRKRRGKKGTGGTDDTQSDDGDTTDSSGDQKTIQ